MRGAHLKAAAAHILDGPAKSLVVSVVFGCFGVWLFASFVLSGTLFVL